MGLSWQQGPLSTGAIGRFLVPQPLPKRMLYVEPLRSDIDGSAFIPVTHRTFCPYKGICSYYDIGDSRLAAWSYSDSYPEVSRVSNLVSFQPDLISVQLDGKQLRLEPGESVIPHGPDRELTVNEAIHPRNETEQSPSSSAKSSSN